MKEYYTALHLLRYKFKYSMESAENLMPWELAIELDMIANDIKKELESKSFS